MRGSEARYRKTVKSQLKANPILWHEEVKVSQVYLEDIIDTPLEPSEDTDYKPDDPIQARFVIMNLSASEVELLLYRYMGFNSKEITKLMGLKNVFWYYRLSDKLRRNTDRLMNID